MLNKLKNRVVEKQVNSSIPSHKQFFSKIKFAMCSLRVPDGVPQKGRHIVDLYFFVSFVENASILMYNVIHKNLLIFASIFIFAMERKCFYLFLNKSSKVN